MGIIKIMSDDELIMYLNRLTAKRGPHIDKLAEIIEDELLNREEAERIKDGAIGSM